MSEIARKVEDGGEEREGGALRRLGGVSPQLPIILNAQQMAVAKENMAAGGGAGVVPFRYVEVPKGVKEEAQEKRAARKESGVLRGIKDLQQLQKQTLAVLESVKANLEDIQQVLRSPEATRGLEKQQNAATLLSKGFARDAVEQALGAVGLLPANPEAHLLLSLSLAADQQFDAALLAARKGLALFDRRSHALAIEAGLLHALAALGCGAEAVERWGVIIEGLPVPVLLEHLGRIAACFPGDAPEGQLDVWVTRRLVRDLEGEEAAGIAIPGLGARGKARAGRLEMTPGEMAAGTLFAGLDAAQMGKLARTHRAILGQVAKRLSEAKEGTDVVRFLTECVIPLGNMGLDRSADALGRAGVKRLLRGRSDAMTLHRAMGKLEMAGVERGAREVATLLNHWRKAGGKVRRARRMLLLSMGMVMGGVVMLAYVLWGMGVIAGKQAVMVLGSYKIDAVWVGPGFIGMGCLVGVFALMGRVWRVELPYGRGRLTVEELRYVRSGAVRRSIRGAMAGKVKG